MTEWGIAVIAAGAAIVGSIVTGWYSRSSGLRQAEAARHAGDRQAEALLESVRITIQAGADQRSLDLRRRTYAEFLGAAETRVLTERTGRANSGDEALLQRALGGVALEGPAEVTAAAQQLVACLRRHKTLDELNRAKLDFVSVAQGVLRNGSGE